MKVSTINLFLISFNNLRLSLILYFTCPFTYFFISDVCVWLSKFWVIEDIVLI